MFWIWLDHFNFLFRVRPRYRVDCTSSNMAPHNLYTFLGGSRLVEKQITLHLAGLKFIFHIVCHCSKRIRSFCICSPSASLEITPYNVSSANKWTVELMLSERSLMYRRKSMGASTVPWGTPSGYDFWPQCLVLNAGLQRYKTDSGYTEILYQFSKQVKLFKLKCLTLILPINITEGAEDKNV